MNPARGLALSLCALACWSIAPFFFTAAGRRIGPLATNMLRLALATLALIALALARDLSGFHVSLPHPVAIACLVGSGFIGLTVGDAFLYRAFVSIGPERTSQIQTLAPASTAALAFLALGEILSYRQLAGMALILAGVLTATTSAARAARKSGRLADPAPADRPTAAYGHAAWAAIWSASFQGVGTVLARQAFLSQSDLDPVLATSIRLAAGTAGLWAYARTRGPLRPTLRNWTEKRTLRLILCGTVFGPTLGMLCYISALKSAPAGIVTTVTFMAPLLIIPIGARLYGTRIGWAALAGTVFSLAGVALLGLR
jgi:drug/metabolite transporter (DMT)-like permease